MSAQLSFDDRCAEGFLLNIEDARGAAKPEKWQVSRRILFCVASAFASWILVMRIAGMIIGF